MTEVYSRTKFRSLFPVKIRFPLLEQRITITLYPQILQRRTIVWVYEENVWEYRIVRPYLSAEKKQLMDRILRGEIKVMGFDLAPL